MNKKLKTSPDEPGLHAAVGPDGARCAEGQPSRLSDRPASPDPMAGASSLRSGQALPLYIRVAQWAMARARPVSRDDISREFRTSARRAGDIMLYIANEGRHCVESERLLVRGSAGRDVALMRVTMVWPECYESPRSGRPGKGGRVARPSGAGAPPELRDLFLRGGLKRGAS